MTDPERLGFSDNAPKIGITRISSVSLSGFGAIPAHLRSEGPSIGSPVPVCFSGEPVGLRYLLTFRTLSSPLQTET